MEKFKSFYVSKSEFDSIAEFQHYLDTLHKNSKVINGFRVFLSEIPSGFYWFTIPNSSDRSFCFNKFSSAEEFCNNYSNYHSNSFWYRLWVKNPIYHFLNVVKLVDSTSHLL